MSPKPKPHDRLLRRLDNPYSGVLVYHVGNSDHGWAIVESKNKGFRFETQLERLHKSLTPVRP